MPRGRGYLLPPGDAYTEDLACALVIYPDKDEYRRALVGSLVYLGTWLAWEGDAGKRGKDAARAWKDANELTLECMSMNYCQAILDKLDEISSRLGMASCCDGNTYVNYNDMTIVTTTIIPGVGAAPTTWGESEEIVDWDEWREYVCGAAHDYVDDLVSKAEDLARVAASGVYTLDFVAYVISVLTYRIKIIPVPVNELVIQPLAKWLIDNIGEMDFEAQAQEFEDNRDEIVCSLVLGLSLEDYVHAAVIDDLMWTYFYSNIDYDSTTSAIYLGEVESHGYLTPMQSAVCSCEYPMEEHQIIRNPDLNLGWGDWTVETPYVWASTQVNIGDEYATNDKFISADSVAVSSGYTKLQVKTTCYHNGSRDSTWYFTFYRASDDAVIHTVYQVCDQKDGQFHEMVHPKFSVEAGETYYVKIRTLAGHAASYAVTKIEGWESVA